MILHNEKLLFEKYVSLVSQKEAIDEAIIVKDYYITLALKLTYQLSPNIVFVGGTSLSKAFNLINRFSEDIDLVITGEKRKGKQKKALKFVQAILNLWGGTPLVSQSSTKDFLEVYLFYKYRNLDKNESRIKLEVLTFTNPFPVKEVYIESILNSYLNHADIKKYEMNPIIVKAQAPYRTFLEKVLLQKEHYKKSITDQIKLFESENRARDFYDIHKIWLFYNRRLPIELETLHTMINSRFQHRINRTKVSYSEFNQYPLINIYEVFNIRHQLEYKDYYRLSIRDLDTIAIAKSLIEIDAFFNHTL